MRNPLRFGFQISGDYEKAPIAAARRAEQIGFDVVLTSDHVGAGLSPLPTLAAIAAATTDIRIGTFVLNNDMRNPVQLAWDASTIDRLSDGRFELGLGAGHTPQEYVATGIEMAGARERKAKLAESTQIIRQLVDGQRVDFDGSYYQIKDARIDAAVQERLPILLGGNGESFFEHAGAHADIVGFQGLGQTREDGHHHEARWEVDRLTAQIEQVRSGAGQRFGDVELNSLVQVVQVTNDRDAALDSIREGIAGLSIDDASEIPYMLVGSVDQIVQQIVSCNERWGISYFVVRELDAFEPIIEAARRP